ncbi:MAG: DegV family protein [Lachnospiraceae bacterium]|nr:DegV family protein [Lachnospiraceae bacterium]MDE6698338.1 DegV family protein [Lachnospiraceae bacterium]
MKDYVIITDNTCDLDEEFYKSHNIPVIVLPYSIDDIVYGTDNKMSIKDFYNSMRNGKMPTTMAANPETYRSTFKKYLDEGLDILYLAFSSALSSSCGNAILAANELNEEYTDNSVTVIDTLCASMGEGLILYKAVMLKEEGKSLEEVAKYVEDNKLKVCHYFTVNDLNHLHRGGRVSKATAIVGTLINVKPVLHVPNAGTLVSVCNVRGRKKSLTTLINNMEERTKGIISEDDVVMIAHGDCIEDAEFVADEIRNKFGIKNIIISYASQTISSHTGPGLIALFFMGTGRE